MPLPDDAPPPGLRQNIHAGNAPPVRAGHAKPHRSDRFFRTATIRPGDAAYRNSIGGTRRTRAPTAISTTTGSLTAPWPRSVTSLTPIICDLASLL